MSTIKRHVIKRFTSGLALAAASLTIAACSSDVERFSEYPNVNTASVPNTSQTEVVTRNRLAGSPAVGQVKPSWQQPKQAWRAPKSTYKAPKTAYNAPSSTYRAPAATTPAYRTGSITVQSGQTMYSIARANGLSVNQLASANNMGYPYTLKVGQRLKVPGVSRPNSPAASFTPRTARNYAPAPVQPTYKAASAPVPKKNFAGKGTHIVGRGETLFSLGRKYGVNPFTIAKYNGIASPYSLNVGQRVKIPANDSKVAWKNSSSATRQVAENRNLATKKPVRITRKTTDRIAPAPVEKVARSQPAVQPSSPVASSGFRWPANGRVISTYGRKSNGMRNEGINIAVPEGTRVRSAESGVVAYAGNELKGYGNLVLVRHKNGWVTAYAHNKELFVKRGDTVKRGEVIAKSGQTGSVKTPQLHFEVRKGANAVDPMKYLSRRTASAQ